MAIILDSVHGILILFKVMDVQEVEKLQKYLRRHKIVLYVIVGFLALLTYLLVVVAGQVSREQAFQGQSKAYDGGSTDANACGGNPTETPECQCYVVADPYNPPRSCGPLGDTGYIKYQCPGDPNGPKTIYVNCQSKECYGKKIAAMNNPFCPTAEPGAGGQQVPTATPMPTEVPISTPVPGECKAKLAYGNPTPAPGNGQCALYSNPRRYAELCFSCPGEPNNSCNHTVSASEIKSTDGSGKCYVNQYTREKVCYKSCATLEELQARANEKCKNMRACPK